MNSARVVLLAVVIVVATPVAADFYSGASGHYLHPVGIKMEMIQENKHASPAVPHHKAKPEAGEISPAAERINANPYGQDLTIINGYGNAVRKGNRGADWKAGPALTPYGSLGQ